MQQRWWAYMYTQERIVILHSKTRKNLPPPPPIKKLQQYPRFQKVFQDLRSALDVQEVLYNTLEKFTCLMYGNAHIKSINELRVFMLRNILGREDTLSSKSIVDLSRLPPWKDSLSALIDRVCCTVCLTTFTWWPWMDQGQWLSRDPVALYFLRPL